jgi:ABC-2 type transport system ATP-binding protein
MNTIVEVENLVKKYGDLTAIDGVSFAIQEGEIFGLLGPNGAGKTTLISVLTCLFPPTEGTVTIAGYDVVQDAAQVKEIIGVVPQDLALYPTISGRDNLIFFGQIYGLRGRELAQRIDQVLDIVGLADRAGDAVETYSGGMKRRLNLAAGLLHRPRVLFLDEPTVGVDPQARNYIFENVEALNREGITILYTTHYMEEAERLCHRVAIIDEGRIIALDTPQGLIALLGGGVIHVGVRAPAAELLDKMRALPGVKEVSTFVPASSEPEERAAEVAFVVGLLTA